MRAAAFAIVVLLVLALSSSTLADDVSFKVIVHPKNPITSIDRTLLRNLFLKKSLEWEHGEIARPVDLAPKFSVREQFTRKVLRKTPAQLKTYWNQQIFSGKGVPPPEVDSTTDVIRFVLANPGAIGYLPADVDPRHAKVLEVR